MPWKPNELIYGHTFHASPIDLCIIFNIIYIYVYIVSCLV